MDASVATEPNDEGRFTEEEHAFLLSRVQPALIGLIEGWLSTLAPFFAVSLGSLDPHIAFFAGLATAVGAAVSMAFSEALSDTGEYTGRGSPLQRGAITGGGTFFGGVFHTLPFLINHYNVAILVAIITVAIELVLLAVIRAKFFRTGFLRSFATVTLGGVIIVAVSAALGSAA
jgi:VIT1/CCC1 family predicted Fe2+/Mn2+ transporter